MSIVTGFYESLTKLGDSTLVKIAEGFNIPGNWYRQGTWDKCIFNQVSEGGTSVQACGAILKENPDFINEVIRHWDALRGRNPNKTLRNFVVQILQERGILFEMNTPEATSRVKSVNVVTKFESTMIPTMDDLEAIELVTDEAIETLLGEMLVNA